MSLEVVKKYQNRKLLFVDDSEHNLIAFKAIFRKSFDVRTSDNPKEALRILEEEEIPIVMSDYRMPDINGVQFLESVKAKFPNSIRMLITGHADQKAAIDAINRGGIFRYVEKPWDNEELEQAVLNGLEVYHTRIQLKRKSEDLQKAYNELDNIIYSAAHDITSPLTTIMGLVNLAREEPNEKQQYLDLIEKSVKKLNIFTKNIISFHKNKRTGISISKIDLKPLVNSTAEDFKFFEKAKEVRFEIEVDQKADYYSDRSRIIMILNNLVSNSIKYQDPQKQAFVKVVVESDAEQVKISVQDNGIGITADRKDKIFDMYYRGTDQRSGSGIGLHIVMEVIRLLDGKIEVESEELKGTTFSVVLPNMA